MSSHMPLPQKVNNEEVPHIFYNLRKHQNSEMVFDLIDPVVDE